MSTNELSANETTSHDHDHDHHDHKPSGITRWLYTTNHKDIGTLYLLFSLLMFFIGGIFAMVIRAELFQPGLQLVEPHFFNQMTTLHGLIMVFVQLCQHSLAWLTG
jgi:cytochrome c oxidase subunit I